MGCDAWVESKGQDECWEKEEGGGGLSHCRMLLLSLTFPKR